jgi:hypothetical protein
MHQYSKITWVATVPSLSSMSSMVTMKTSSLCGPYETKIQTVSYPWNHWKKIRASKAIQPWIEDWNEELEVKLRSVGIQVVLDEAQGGKSAYQAGKAIAEGFWAPRLTTGSPKRGRPSKEEVAKELKIQTRLHEEFKDDAERIGLSLSVGTNEVQ